MLRITGIALFIATIMAILGCGGGSHLPAPASPPPAPDISISPTSGVAGSPDLTLTVMGSNFLGETHNFSQAVWLANSSTTLLATTFVSSTQLTAVIPSALLSNPLTAEVFVQTGDPTVRHHVESRGAPQTIS
jgi:IPT/TIG domain